MIIKGKFLRYYMQDMKLYPKEKPDINDWFKDDKVRRYLTYHEKTNEYHINLWRDDINGKWYWVHDGVTHWKELS